MMLEIVMMGLNAILLITVIIVLIYYFKIITGVLNKLEKPVKGLDEGIENINSQLMNNDKKLIEINSQLKNNDNSVKTQEVKEDF